MIVIRDEANHRNAGQKPSHRLPYETRQACAEVEPERVWTQVEFKRKRRTGCSARSSTGFRQKMNGDQATELECA